MHPSPSVIVFTVLSGAGYGLLFCIGLGAMIGGLPDNRIAALLISGLSLLLITGGLVSSTFHLGRPERAWRAISQWRSSWLSREGVAALITYVPALILAWDWVSDGEASAVVGLIAALMAAVTVYCTGMIYASLKTIPDWHSPLVPLVYLTLAPAVGGLFGLVAAGAFGFDLAWLEISVLAFTLLAWAAKWLSFEARGLARPGSTAATALGLSDRQSVKLIEPPHQGSNYIMREMIFTLGRKHAEKLKTYMWLAGLLVPSIVLLLLLARPADGFAFLLAALGLMGAGLGCLIERWLFFAEAKHKVALYYGVGAV